MATGSSSPVQEPRLVPVSFKQHNNHLDDHYHGYHDVIIVIVMIMMSSKIDGPYHSHNMIIIW